MPESLLFQRLQACNFIEKETMAQVFSCEFIEISKKPFSYRTPPVAVSHIKYIRVNLVQDLLKEVPLNIRVLS